MSSAARCRLAYSNLLYRHSTGSLIRNTYFEQGLIAPRMQAQFLISPFLIASQEYCTYFLFPPFLVSSAVISSHFLRQSLLFSSPFCGRCMCVSACCGTAAVVHPHDPMTKDRGGCRECQSPVHCGTPLPRSIEGKSRTKLCQKRPQVPGLGHLQSYARFKGGKTKQGYQRMVGWCRLMVMADGDG